MDLHVPLPPESLPALIALEDLAIVPRGMKLQMLPERVPPLETLGADFADESGRVRVVDVRVVRRHHCEFEIF